MSETEQAILKLRILFANSPMDFYGEAVLQAIDALEKQVAKKVTHEASIRTCCTCPSCLNVVDEFEKFGNSTVRVTYSHCKFCGQKLDWSEPNE